MNEGSLSSDEWARIFVIRKRIRELETELKDLNKELFGIEDSPKPCLYCGADGTPSKRQYIGKIKEPICHHHVDVVYTRSVGP